MSDLHRLRRYGYRGEGDDILTELVGDIHWAADEIDRLTAENKRLREDLAAAEATWIMWRNKLKEKVVGSHDPIDGYCGKKSSKAGLQAGEVDLKEEEIKEYLWKTL